MIVQFKEDTKLNLVEDKNSNTVSYTFPKGDMYFALMAVEANGESCTIIQKFGFVPLVVPMEYLEVVEDVE